MKKNLFKFFTLLLMLFTIPSIITYANSNRKVEVLGATFEVTENLINRNIGYDITHLKDNAKSSSYAHNSSNSPDPQTINILNIPSNDMVRVVNWTYMKSNGWSKQTVVSLAKNFELHNPGWIVLAGVNGDFFDIRGNFPLPYQTNGVAISDGEVYRPYSTNGSNSSVGFKNDGSNAPLVGQSEITFSDLKLEIYDENDQVIKTFDIDHLNEMPNKPDAVSIYFSYPDENQQTVSINAPKLNSYLIEAPIRCLPTDSNNLYGKGHITSMNAEKTLFIGQFAVVSENPEIQNLLDIGTKVRIQRHVIGDYAECDNVLGRGAILVNDGQAIENNNGDRHPRTCIGMDKDGNIILMTVDGRQESSNMFGMSYEELSAALLNYGCREAYNLDGGGSTTMIVRNNYGDFDIMNSPSDGGNGRADSNAILIVVPEINLSIDMVEDKYINLSYPDNIKNVQYSDFNVTVNGQTKLFNTKQFTYDNLTPNTNYHLTYTYKRTYKGRTDIINGSPISFNTGKNKPFLEDYYYTETDHSYLLNFKILDPDNTISMIYIKYEGNTKYINKNTTTYEIPKNKVSSNDFVIIIEYELNANPYFEGKSSFTISKLEDNNEPDDKKGCNSCKKSDGIVIFSILNGLLIILYLRRKNK